jgi:hypothetical protein
LTEDEAHKFSIRNRKHVEESEVCGCFYCLAIFAPAEIEDWTDEDDEQDTALCPRCGIDSVIGSSCGAPITPEFLGAMNMKWFSVNGPH